MDPTTTSDSQRLRSPGRHRGWRGRSPCQGARWRQPPSRAWPPSAGKGGAAGRGRKGRSQHRRAGTSRTAARGRASERASGVARLPCQGATLTLLVWLMSAPSSRKIFAISMKPNRAARHKGESPSCDDDGCDGTRSRLGKTRRAAGGWGAPALPCMAHVVDRERVCPAREQQLHHVDVALDSSRHEGRQEALRKRKHRRRRSAGREPVAIPRPVRHPPSLHANPGPVASPALGHKFRGLTRERDSMSAPWSSTRRATSVAPTIAARLSALSPFCEV